LEQVVAEVMVLYQAQVQEQQAGTRLGQWITAARTLQRIQQ